MEQCGKETIKEEEVSFSNHDWFKIESMILGWQNTKAFYIEDVFMIRVCVCTCVYNGSNAGFQLRVSFPPQKVIEV